MSKPRLNALPHSCQCLTVIRPSTVLSLGACSRWTLMFSPPSPALPGCSYARACNIIIHSCVIIDGMADIFIKCDPFPNYHPLWHRFKVDLDYQMSMKLHAMSYTLILNIRQAWLLGIMYRSTL